MLNEINCWQCEKRKGGEENPNPYKIRITLAAGGAAATSKGLQTANSKMTMTESRAHVNPAFCWLRHLFLLNLPLFVQFGPSLGSG